MPPLETPHKAIKMDLFSTPGKRRYDEMASGDVKATWTTPTTGERGGEDIFTTPSTAGKRLFANPTLPSPAETPTPIRYKDVPVGQNSELASDLSNALKPHTISLSPSARDAVKAVCDKHVLYTRGVMKGRDVSRAMVKRKDEQISKLQGEIEGLKAERETNRAVIRHLRRDLAMRKENE